MLFQVLILLDLPGPTTVQEEQPSNLHFKEMKWKKSCILMYKNMFTIQSGFFYIYIYKTEAVLLKVTCELFEGRVFFFTIAL